MPSSAPNVATTRLLHSARPVHRRTPLRQSHRSACFTRRKAPPADPKVWPGLSPSLRGGEGARGSYLAYCLRGLIVIHISSDVKGRRAGGGGAAGWGSLSPARPRRPPAPGTGRRQAPSPPPTRPPALHLRHGAPLRLMYNDEPRGGEGARASGSCLPFSPRGGEEARASGSCLPFSPRGGEGARGRGVRPHPLTHSRPIGYAPGD